MSDLRDQITEALRAGRCCAGHIPRIADAVARRIEPEIERLTQRAEQAEAAVERARDVCARMRSHPAARPWADAIDRALDRQEEGQ